MDSHRKTIQRIQKHKKKLMKEVPLFSELFALSYEEAEKQVKINLYKKERFAEEFDLKMKNFQMRASKRCAVYIQILYAVYGAQKTLTIYEELRRVPRYNQIENLSSALCSLCANKLKILPLTVFQFAEHACK